jgi:ketosteroid isomerase-like protein
MYHTIVKRIAKKNFELVSQKNYEALLKSCVPKIHHKFGGRHALGGERHDIDALRRWFSRLGRLGPELKLTVSDVWVKGWPDNTTIIIRWDATDRMANGDPYKNHGVHIVKMRWGKIYDIDANEDSQAVADNLKMHSEYGVEEASAPPITS